MTQRFFPRRFFPVVRALLAATILALLLSKVHPRALLAAAGSANASLLLLVALFALVNLGLQIYRWRLVAHLTFPDLDWRGAARSFLAGLSLGIATPGRVGELGRAYFVPESSKSLMAGMTLLDKYFTLSTTVVLGILGLAYLPLFEPALDVGLVAAAGLMLSWLVSPQFARRLAQFFPERFRNHPQVREFAAGARVIRPLDAVRFALLNMLILATIGVQFCLAVSAFGSVACPSGIAAALATLAAKVVLPLSVGDVGVREAASALLFRYAGATPASAVSGALTIYVVNVALPALVGLHWVAGLSPRKGTVKHEERTSGSDVEPRRRSRPVPRSL